MSRKQNIIEISHVKSLISNGGKENVRPSFPLHSTLSHYSYHSVTLLMAVVSLMTEEVKGGPIASSSEFYTTASPYYPQSMLLLSTAMMYPSTRLQVTTPRIPVYYTTTYATSSYYNEARKYRITKAPEYYTTTCATACYYTGAPQYCSTPSYTRTTVSYYTNGSSKVLRRSRLLYTGALPSYYTEHTNYTEAPWYYSSGVITRRQHLHTTPSPATTRQSMPPQLITQRLQNVTRL